MTQLYEGQPGTLPAGIEESCYRQTGELGSERMVNAQRVLSKEPLIVRKGCGALLAQLSGNRDSLVSGSWPFVGLFINAE